MSETGALILTYHHVADAGSDAGVLNVSPRHNAEQLEVLRRAARPMRLSRLVETLKTSAPPPRSVVITMDDGYADHLTNAKPLLDRYDIPATMFVTTGAKNLGPEFWWDELERLLLLPGAFPERFDLSVSGETVRCDLGESAVYTSVNWLLLRDWKVWEDPPTPRHRLFQLLCPMFKPMGDREQQEVMSHLRNLAEGKSGGIEPHRRLSAAEISATVEGGLIDVGAHTITHPMLSMLPTERQRAEIEGGQAYLEGILSSPVRAFAYPYGDYSHETIRLVRESGFESACSTAIGQVHRHSDPFQLARHSVFDLGGDEFSDWLHRIWSVG